ETRRCGGCHENRTETVAPRSGSRTIAETMGVEDFVKPIPSRLEIPWKLEACGSPSSTSGVQTVQNVLDAKCVGCHSGGVTGPCRNRSYPVRIEIESGQPRTYQIPYLDLSERCVETLFQGQFVSYPASYFSLLYPSAMTGEVTAMGTVPPLWVVPGSARESRL